MIGIPLDRQIDEGELCLVQIDGRTVSLAEAPATRDVTVTLLTDSTFTLVALEEEAVGVFADPAVRLGVATLDEPERWKKADWPRIMTLPTGSYYLRHGDAKFALVLGDVEDA